MKLLRFDGRHRVHTAPLPSSLNHAGWSANADQQAFGLKDTATPRRIKHRLPIWLIVV